MNSWEPSGRENVRGKSAEFPDPVGEGDGVMGNTHNTVRGVAAGALSAYRFSTFCVYGCR